MNPTTIMRKDSMEMGPKASPLLDLQSRMQLLHHPCWGLGVNDGDIWHRMALYFERM